MSCRTRNGGWSPGTGKDKFKAEDQEIADAYQGGATLEVLAQRYGVTQPAIAYRLNRAGVPRRKNDGSALQRPEIRAKVAASHVSGSKHHQYRHDVSDQDLIDAYKRGASTMKIGKQFGISASTVLNRLKGAGVTIRHAGYSRPVVCRDGHVASSHWEQCVDDWLFLNNIPHTIHPLVPWYRTGQPLGYADFKTGNYYIEVWGLDGQPAYDARRLQKVAKYRECGANLIEVFPHHLSSDDFSPLHVLL